MTAVSETRARIQWMLSDDAERDVCLRVLDALSGNARDSDSLTYAEIGNLIGLPAHDALLQNCVNLLATSPKVKLLDMHFVFFDPNNPEDIGEPIPDSEVRQAFASGFLVHPILGTELQDFARHLSAYFTPRDVLRHGEGERQS